MLHLSTERLAALGDEQPTAGEAAHLALCDACAHERDAYRTLVAMAEAERTPFGLPLTRWDAIAAVLHEDSRSPTARRASWTASRWPMQAAAGLLLLVSGAVLGRASAGLSLPPLAGGNRVAATTARVAAPARTEDDSVFASVEDARSVQHRAEQRYQQAVAYLARFDSTAVDDGSPVALKSRLAAIDRVISVTSEAMRDAPHDPVINGYYLTTLGQREATIRQLSTALPVSIRLSSF
jgi:hypothetical protein